MKEKIFAGAAGSLALVLLVGVTSSINAGADTNGDATESKQTVIESDISYYADELAGGLASVAIGKLFDKVALDLVDAVVRRASQQLEPAR